MTRSKWHVTVQTTGLLFCTLGVTLGALHPGRRYESTAHDVLAATLASMLAAQTMTGLVMRLRPVLKSQPPSRTWCQIVHRVLGQFIVLCSWAQLIVGCITILDFCGGWFVSQCTLHIMPASAFIAHGVGLSILSQVGRPWLTRTGRSVDFFESLHIMVWGLIITIGNYHWHQGLNLANARNIEHTGMGILLCCAAILGLWQTGTRSKRPKQSIVPSLTFSLIGYLLTWHGQDSELSSKVHVTLGYHLMALGVTRIIDFGLKLQDRHQNAERAASGLLCLSIYVSSITRCVWLRLAF